MASTHQQTCLCSHVSHRTTSSSSSSSTTTTTTTFGSLKLTVSNYKLIISGLPASTLYMYVGSLLLALKAIKAK
jgi:hypothetical protein